MLKSICKLQLAERPYFTSVSDDGRRFAFSAESGRCQLFDNDLRLLDETDLGAGVRSIQLNEIGTVLQVGFDDHMQFFATSGNIARLFNLPIGHNIDNSSVFRTSEQTICVASWDQMPKLTAWDLNKRVVIDEVPLPDRGGAGFFLVPHPEGEAMAVIACSGQSEEWMFWAHYAAGRLRVFLEPEIEDVALPCFHPTGRELLSKDERLGLCRMRFPSGERIASVQPEEAFADGSEDMFSYEMHFFRDDRFLVWQCDLSLYEFDLATLRPTATLLTGADGMTFGEDRFFSGGSWKLADNRLLTCDTLHDKGFQYRIDTLRLWDATEHSRSDTTLSFGNQHRDFYQPDPTRPYTRELLAMGP